MDLSKSPSRKWLTMLRRLGVKEVFPGSARTLHLSDEFCTQFSRLVGPADLDGGILTTTNSIEEDIKYLPNVTYTRARMVMAMVQCEQDSDTQPSQNHVDHRIQQNSLHAISEHQESSQLRQANKIYRGARHVIDWRTPLDFIRATANNQHPSDVLLGAALHDADKLAKKLQSLETKIAMLEKANEQLRRYQKAEVEEIPVTEAETEDIEAEWAIV